MIGVRRERLALVTLWLLATALITLVTAVFGLMAPFIGLTTLLAVIVLYRYGLLATVAALFFFHLWVFFRGRKNQSAIARP